MNAPSLLTQTTAQVWGAKQNAVKPKPIPFLSQRMQTSAIFDAFITTLGVVSPTIPSDAQMLLETKAKIDDEQELFSREFLLKEKTLALIHRDKSTPMELHLKRGAVKELDDGVFAKRRLDDVLEIYVSEE